MTVKQLQEEIAVKDKFIALLAHDLRNPIGLLKNFSDLLLEQVDNYSNKELIEKLGFINDLSNNTFNLLDNLILWLKTHNGSIAFNGISCKLDKIFNDSLSSVKHQAEVKKITIIKPANRQVDIFTDPNILSTIIRNLLSNAVKYSYEEGKLYIDYKITGDYLTIKIKDEGTGIEQNNLDAILDTDKYTESTNGTRGEAGTGIGLNLCKTLVAELKGSLWGKSKVGEGTAMFVKIPVVYEKTVNDKVIHSL